MGAAYHSPGTQWAYFHTCAGKGWEVDCQQTEQGLDHEDLASAAYKTS